MKTLSIDIETYAGLSLADVGQYRYAEAKDFEILLFAYSVDNGEVKVVDFACGEKLPEEIVYALTDENVIKWAFNAVFERVCISRYLRDIGVLAGGEMIPAEQWRCSSVWAGYLGYPQSLAGAGEALNLKEQKMSEGKELIELFCRPHEELEKKRVFPADQPEKWEIFKEYNRRDVEVELKVKERLAKIPVPENIWEEYFLEQRINDRGVCVDLTFVRQAILIGEIFDQRMAEYFKTNTGMEISCSGVELHQWIAVHKEQAEERTKGKVHSRAIDAWSHYRKSAVKNYKSLLNLVCEDGKIHGAFRFYGERRNGNFSSWIGRFLSPTPFEAELPVNIREIIKQGNVRFIRRFIKKKKKIPAHQILTHLIPTSFVPEYRKRFQKLTRDNPDERAFMSLTGAKGSPENILKYKGLMKKLRKAVERTIRGEAEFLAECINQAPEILDFYIFICTGVENVVRNNVAVKKHGVSIFLDNGSLAVELPSGRRMYYAEPEISEDFTGLQAVFAKGCSPNRTEWKKEYLITAAIVLDIVKGIARDKLYELMAEKENIVMHTRDTIYIDAPV